MKALSNRGWRGLITVRCEGSAMLRAAQASLPAGAAGTASRKAGGLKPSRW